MAASGLRDLIADAPEPLCNILDGTRGALEPPIRSEIFGLQRFAQHGRSLGETHRAERARFGTATFFPRLRGNIQTLREAQHFIGEQASTGYDISPAAEWLLDNFHLIEAQLKEIHEGLPRSYFRALPVLVDEPLAGLPRVYSVAWAFVAHTDGAFDEDLLMQFLRAYHETRELNLSEMWALPTTLRVVLIENLRRLAERVAANKAAREVANLCCDHLEDHSLATLDQLLALLNRRGVGRVFLAQLAQRLQDPGASGNTGYPTRYPARYHEWLQAALPDWATVQTQQSADQAADNLSVSNAVTSLRAIGDADWPDIVAHTSTLMRLMLTAPVFEAEHATTRDETLHGIEKLARRADRGEVAVAQTLLALMQGTPDSPAAEAHSSPGYWIDGEGRPALLRALGLPECPWVIGQALVRDLALPIYLGALLAGTAGVVAWLLTRHGAGPHPAWSLSDPAAPWWLIAAGAILMLCPASETVVAVMNRLISESLHPRHLPRLALAAGIPGEHRVLVVIPAMLTDSRSIETLVHRLCLHHLANPEHHAQFALLTDWADADTWRTGADDALLAGAVEQIRALNARHPRPPDGAGAVADTAPRFIILHRERSFSPTEQRWIGWERKRGKLELLVAALAADQHEDDAGASAFLQLGAESSIAAATRYIVTLDSDTQLPPGRLRELVSIAAHPRNQPRLDASGRMVVSGYGILQPRVVTPLPAPGEVTLYHWLFAGQCGIDPYSAATSEIYQDVFGEGSFTGKGLLNVAAMHAVLTARLPEGQVLSHDLLEGSMARCAAATDVTVIEDAPFHADVAASRVHRWTRGDWQLLPILLQPRRYPLRAINRWKMFDNLRRSLVAPMSLALLWLTLYGRIVSPWAALALVMAAFSAGPLMGALAAFSPSRDSLAMHRFYGQAASGLARVLWGGLWHVAQLLQQALLSVDAIVRALYRMTISHRHLLQWTTAATAQAAAQTRFAAIVRVHWSLPVVALGLLTTLFALGTPHPLTALLLCMAWGASPLWTWWVSRPRPADDDARLSAADDAYLRGIARDTWRLFERCVGPEDSHLPPDNLQVLPHDMVAHRTSPTNIGLYLLSVACARRFGWIGTQDLLARMEATLATLATLQRHRGHFLNWYDTQSRAPLMPMYVSTVDSGNLSGHLLAVAQACLELAEAPYDPAAALVAIEASRQRLAPLLGPGHAPAVPGDAALMRLLAMTDAAHACRHDMARFDQLLHDAGDELDRLLPESTDADPAATPTARDQLRWMLVDHLATLRSLRLDTQADSATQVASQRLRALTRDCENLAWEADFCFLYHRKRNLFHIGYRVAEQQLDASFYDLLASESRLTSLLAVAKGDVPVRHWTSLGRLFFADGADVGLRSWSGSMFEYLMPTLVLDEPDGSVLHAACHAAIVEQIAFTASRNIPWGVSESAYAGRDYTLAYQYAPQGVPRLALRRTPTDELVISPYSTALAAQVAPHRAASNFAALEALAARGRYGFIEALDYSPARQNGADPYTPVGTFMAHHQGMSIVALANVLLDGTAQRWGMANAHIEAVASLLHEHTPREVSRLYAPPPAPPAKVLQQRAPGLLREVAPGESAIEPTHLLSNGRYSVTLRPNGAGWSRRGQTGISRARDDALRDAFGSFFYLRRTNLFDDDGLRIASGAAPARPVSLTQHPAADPAARYGSQFHADRVCFDAVWPDLQAHITVWVSPEDDIEFRQIELRNLSDRSIDLELISAFEVTLSEARADEAHPAFANLFVRAAWQAEDQALMFERKPRLPGEQGLGMAHFLAYADPVAGTVSAQTDRQLWLGRNRGADAPLARLDVMPTAPVNPLPGHNKILDTGLDPVCAMSVRLCIEPNAKASLTFATAASDNIDTLNAVIDKYRQASHIQRASLMSATLTSIRLRALRIGSDNFATMQTLTTALVLSLTRPRAATARMPDGLASVDTSADAGAGTTVVCDRRLPWRFGISGDRPVVLVSASVTQGLGMLRALAQALQQWSWGGIACDLVVVNAEPASYVMTLQRELTALRERHDADSAAQAGPGNPASTGFHVLRADELSADEWSTLQCLARVRFHADGRPLAHHVQEWSALHEQDFARRNASPAVALLTSSGATERVAAPTGAFVAASNEFRFDVDAGLRPPRPWINVLANPGFGAHISEAGGGYSWALNSRMNQLTAWSNDAVGDAPAEWFLLQDRKTRQVWSMTPSAAGDEHATYHIAHGQGYSSINHRRARADGDTDVTASWCVDAHSAVKQIRVRIVNRGYRTAHLRIIGVAEWMMGANRSDRGTVHTSQHRRLLQPARLAELNAGSSPAQSLTTLLCTQHERSAGFGNGTAFLAIAGGADERNDGDDWTCDRRECFDTRGRPVVPDRFGRRDGAGLDPCAALAVNVRLGAGDMVERVFLLGHGDSPESALRVAGEAALVPAAQRFNEARAWWDRLLGAATVKTPDPLFDAMVNRWLLYQTVACRLWAKAGFYQAGGATGFRDQLQDAMALAWAAPDMLREQIKVCAARQFPEGDVQHWWHAPTGAGVRTHFSDDLLWLPHACLHYLRTTGDTALLDEQVSFLEGSAIPEGAEDIYEVPAVGALQASVYEHAARAIDRSLRVGVHGLPLMGSGDWNDGMNRVGIGGRGESVWLGWFLSQVATDFAPLARGRGDAERALRWENAAIGWKAALLGPAWDGQWFKRAFFDDGEALGSHTSAEARIDLIAQAWAVLSEVAPVSLQRMALQAVEDHLVHHDAGLIRLLDPPFAHALPSAGYIQAYPPGVRENGGQYSHAGVWALMAQARARANQLYGHPVSGPPRAGAEVDGDIAWRYFTWLSPAHRAADPVHGAVYAIEPYVMAGDVYSQPPYVGRGGWSWYTGSAAWMQRAAIESIFGLRQGAQELSFRPCLPSHWPQAELTLRRDDRTMRFVLVRDHDGAAAQWCIKLNARLLHPGEALHWPAPTAQTCYVIPLPDLLKPAPTLQP